MTALDRPVWASLTSYHAERAVGSGAVRRFHPDINVFLSGEDDRPETMAQAADLVTPGSEVVVLQAQPVTLPEGFEVVMAAPAVQMVWGGGDLAPVDTRDLVRLGPDDASEMVELADLTRPGPMLARTHEMGPFWGIRINGRLAAMAGHRMRFPGHIEVSGVCTHPDFQGRGLASHLSLHATRKVLEQGETPFLQAWAERTGTIRLYERLGFRWRRDFHAVVLRRQG